MQQIVPAHPLDPLLAKKASTRLLLVCVKVLFGVGSRARIRLISYDIVSLLRGILLPIFIRIRRVGFRQATQNAD